MSGCSIFNLERQHDMANTISDRKDPNLPALLAPSGLDCSVRDENYAAKCGVLLTVLSTVFLSRRCSQPLSGEGGVPLRPASRGVGVGDRCPCIGYCPGVPPPSELLRGTNRCCNPSPFSDPISPLRNVFTFQKGLTGPLGLT